jgi:O-antigen/teichoic acid export membrane protein
VSLRTLIVYAMGPVGAALIGLVTLPMLTWLYSPDIVGSYSLLNIGLSLISLIFALGFDQAYVREYYNFDNHAKLLKHCVVPAFALLTVLLVTISVIYAFDLFGFSQSSLSLLVFGYLAVGYFVIANLFTSYYFRMQQNALMYSLCQFIPKLSFMILIVLFYLGGVLSGFLSIAVAQFLAIISLSTLMLFQTRKVWLALKYEPLELPILKRLFTFGFPLVFANLTFWALTSVDRLALTYWADMTAVGIFSVGVSLAMAAGVLQVVFSAIWSPMIYRWEKEGIENYTEQFDSLFSALSTVIFAAFCIVGLFAWVIDFALPEQYQRVKYILVCSFAYPLFFTLSEITVVGLHLMRRTYYVLLASCTALIINLIVNFWLTPSLSVSGAAIATAVSFYSLFIVRTEMSASVWRSFSRFKTYGFGAVILILACVQALSSNAYLYWAICWGGLLLLIIALGRQQFKTLFMLLKQR